MEKATIKIGVNIFIFNKKKQLLMGRRIGKNGYGTWCLPGGHLEYGETFESAAKRELLEETGLVADKVEFVHVINDRREDSHYVHVNFKAIRWSGVPKLTEPDKFSAWEWFDLNDLPKDIFIGHQKYIPAFLSGVKYLDSKQAISQ